MFAQNSYLSNNFKWAIFEYEGVLHIKRYDYPESPIEIMDAPLCDAFSTMRMKMLNRLDGVLLYGKLGVNLFSMSEMLYPGMEIRLRVIRARPSFYMISDNPHGSLWFFGWSLYARGIVVNDDYQMNKIDMPACTPVEFNHLEPLAKFFSRYTKPVHSRTHF